MYFVEELKRLENTELRKNLHINFEGEGGIVKNLIYKLRDLNYFLKKQGCWGIKKRIL